MREACEILPVDGNSMPALRFFELACGKRPVGERPDCYVRVLIDFYTSPTRSFTKWNSDELDALHSVRSGGGGI